MASNQLQRLVEDVKRSGTARTLKEDEAVSFYNQFRKEMLPVVEGIRDQEKRAHEEAKTISLA